jgi:hypothetical protein
MNSPAALMVQEGDTTRADILNAHAAAWDDDVAVCMIAALTDRELFNLTWTTGQFANAGSPADRWLRRLCGFEREIRDAGDEQAMAA